MIHNIHRKDHIFGSYMCLFIDFSGFTSYFTVDAHIHINCINCISCTYFKLRYEQPLSTITSCNTPAPHRHLHIYHSIDMREVFSITNVLATQSKCIHQEKISFRMMHRMSYAIMCPWPTGPRHRAVYTRIYIHVVVDDMRMAILCNTRSYDIVCVVTTTS